MPRERASPRPSWSPPDASHWASSARQCGTAHESSRLPAPLTTACASPATSLPTTPSRSSTASATSCACPASRPSPKRSSTRSAWPRTSTACRLAMAATSPRPGAATAPTTRTGASAGCRGCGASKPPERHRSCTGPRSPTRRRQPSRSASATRPPGQTIVITLTGNGPKDQDASLRDGYTPLETTASTSEVARALALAAPALPLG